jgi:hypothetical protein
MKLTQKLLGLLHRVFDPDPESFLALQIGYDGDGLTWEVSNAVLTTSVSGGQGVDLALDLTDYTIAELIAYISAAPGYSILKGASAANQALSARILIDATGDLADDKGDRLYAYSSLTWAYLEAYSLELQAAATQIPLAIEQMSLATADDEWLDELGAYYNCARQTDELDSSYGPRIVATTLRPRCNNIAIEQAITFYTGQSTNVTDVTVYSDVAPLYNSQITRDSSYNYISKAVPKYGLFDVEYGYDLLGGDDPTAFAARIATIIETIRSAGTHLRSLSLQAGTISDTLDEPADTFSTLTVAPLFTDTLDEPADGSVVLASILSAFTDTLDAPSDDNALSGSIVYDYHYDSKRYRNGAITFHGGITGAL